MGLCGSAMVRTLTQNRGGDQWFGRGLFVLRQGIDLKGLDLRLFRVLPRRSGAE